jgi:hypothetical protein
VAANRRACWPGGCLPAPSTGMSHTPAPRTSSRAIALLAVLAAVLGLSAAPASAAAPDPAISGKHLTKNLPDNFATVTVVPFTFYEQKKTTSRVKVKGKWKTVVTKKLVKIPACKKVTIKNKPYWEYSFRIKLPDGRITEPVRWRWTSNNMSVAVYDAEHVWTIANNYDVCGKY